MRQPPLVKAMVEEQLTVPFETLLPDISITVEKIDLNQSE